MRCPESDCPVRAGQKAAEAPTCQTLVVNRLASSYFPLHDVGRCLNPIADCLRRTAAPPTFRPLNQVDLRRVCPIRKLGRGPKTMALTPSMTQPTPVDVAALRLVSAPRPMETLQREPV